MSSVCFTTSESVSLGTLPCLKYWLKWCLWSSLGEKSKYFVGSVPVFTSHFWAWKSFGKDLCLLVLKLCTRNRLALRPAVPPVIIPRAYCTLGISSSILFTPMLSLSKPGGFKTKSDIGPSRLSVVVLVSFNTNWLDFITCLCICLALF